MNTPSEFRTIEIDDLDEKLVTTAKHKRIPSLRVDEGAAVDMPQEKASEPEPTHRPKPLMAPRKAISLEVPEYLATELKVAAAKQSVTVRHLVLTALAEAGFRIEPADMDEDGRRLR